MPQPIWAFPHRVTFIVLQGLLVELKKIQSLRSYKGAAMNPPDGAPTPWPYWGHFAVGIVLGGGQVLAVLSGLAVVNTW